MCIMNNLLYLSAGKILEKCDDGSLLITWSETLINNLSNSYIIKFTHKTLKYLQKNINFELKINLKDTSGQEFFDDEYFLNKMASNVARYIIDLQNIVLNDNKQIHIPEWLYTTNNLDHKDNFYIFLKNILLKLVDEIPLNRDYNKDNIDKDILLLCIALFNLTVTLKHLDALSKINYEKKKYFQSSSR